MLYCKSYCFFVFYCARQVGRILFTGPGFLLSFFRSKRGEVFLAVDGRWFSPRFSFPFFIS